MHDLHSFLQHFKQVRRQTLRATPEEARQLMHQCFYVPLAQREKVVRILDEHIRTPENNIPVRLYIPQGTPPFPIIVFYHWGGWVYGSIEESDPLCRKLCNRTGAIIASVEYRLAPEHPYPAPVNDCYAAAAWAAKHSHEFLGDPSRLAVAGESAGGNLAAAVALKAAEQTAFNIALQVLICPILAYNLDRETYPCCPDQILVTRDSLRWFWQQYLPNGKSGKDPLVTPFDADHFNKFPKTVILTAGNDPLRGEAMAYAKHLRKHHQSVLLLDYPSALHGFLSFPVNTEMTQKAMDELCRDIHILLAK